MGETAEGLLWESLKTLLDDGLSSSVLLRFLRTRLVTREMPTDALFIAEIGPRDVVEPVSEAEFTSLKFFESCIAWIPEISCSGIASISLRSPQTTLPRATEALVQQNSIGCHDLQKMPYSD